MWMKRKYSSISDPLGNTGFILQKGTEDAPIFIIRKPSISKPAEVVEKEVRKEVEHNGHDEDIASGVIDWRDFREKTKPKFQPQA
jgi:hypothetical protein